MGRWKLLSLGHGSPIAGRDVYNGMSGSELLLEVLSKDRSLVSLQRTSVRLRAYAILFFVLFLVVFLLLASMVVGNSDDRQQAQAQDAGQATAASPRVTSLPCAQGKWITLLGGWKPTDERSNVRLILGVSNTVRDVQRRVKNSGARIALNYTWTDGSQCRTIGTGYYVLWSGPYSDATSAQKVCNKLGWTKASDYDSCHGLTIDRDYEGKRHIRPDGVYQ